MVMRIIAALSALALSLAAAPGRTPPASRVEMIAVPDGGIQPQAVIDSSGTIHLLYFKGEAAHGDLFYAQRRAGGSSFSLPVRVNSTAGTAIATGSVRGGRLALGRHGWLHVAWNGATAVEGGGVSQAPMWYTRIAPGGHPELQRAIGTHTRHLDGGGAVAAGADGSVHVTWHAAGDVDGETHRRIYLASSRDDGATFAPETPFATAAGNCGCCQLDTLVDARARLQVLYRSAADGVHRDSMWLTVANGRASAPVVLQPWDIPACPMTTFAMADTGDEIVAAWETAQQIFTATLNPATRQFSKVAAMAGEGVRKHPSIAVNAAGDRLFAWTEGTAWARGGTVAWELRNRSGAPIASGAKAGAVPVWSLVAALARPDGSFVVLH